MDKSYLRMLLIVSLWFSNLMSVNGCGMRRRCNNFPDLSKDISPDIPTTGPSILDCYSQEMQSSALLNIVGYESFSEGDRRLCPNSKSGLYKHQVLDGIERALKFYEAHLDLVDERLDSIVGLLALREIDDKFGGSFQKKFPITKWLMGACTKIKTADSVEGKTCLKIVESVKAPTSLWKLKTVLEGQIETLSETSIGAEGDDLWGLGKRGCFAALVNNCEVPFICGKSLGDPTPRSQYFLTHQALYRILAEQMSGCITDKTLVDEQVNHQLCAKMYKEAELVARLNYSAAHRHMFSEYVGFCGYMGYPNLFREDWLQNLLSWQSRSEYGCFAVEKKAKTLFLDEDGFITRRPTPSELEKDIKDSEEECLLQSTTIGLFALAMHWNYLEENC